MISILLVDDHSIVRNGISNLLNQQEDIRIMSDVESGSEALAVIESGLIPDILLTDLHLADMTGVALTRQVHAIHPGVKVIMLTMDTHEKYLVQAFQAGVKGYLLKETGFDELLFAVRKVYKGRQFICTAMTVRIIPNLISDRQHVSDFQTDIDLSVREQEILVLLSDGYTNMQIADKLFNSKRTVEGHRQSLLNKTGVRNTAELIKFAMMHGLLKLGAS